MNLPSYPSMGTNESFEMTCFQANKNVLNNLLQMCLDPGMAPCFSFLSSVVRTSSRMMELSSRPDFTFSKSISETSPIAVDDDLDDDDEDLRVAAVLRTFRIIQYRLCISKVALNS